MSNTLDTPDLALIVAIAKQAAKAIMAVYESDFSSIVKADYSPLTEADSASHRIIEAGLSALSPLPILSEEGVDIAWEERKMWTRYWLVDPLDGTKEFIARNNEFTVNIALIDHGQPLLGVVVAPALRRAYFALQGMGAFRQDDDLLPVSLHVSSDFASGAANRLWRVVGSRSHVSTLDQQFLQLFGDTAVMVPMGSSLKFCLIAEGNADLYPRLGLTSEWDTAAAQCIVEAAGGAVLTNHLTPLTYNSKASLLNPHFIACNSLSETWMPFFSDPSRRN